MQVLSTEMHRMSGVWLLSRTDAEKVKASDAVSKSVLRVAKVGHDAMQAANNATLWGASLWGDEWRVAARSGFAGVNKLYRFAFYVRCPDGKPLICIKWYISCSFG